MLKKLSIIASLLLCFALGSSAQGTLFFPPPARALYLSADGGHTWAPMTGVGSGGALSFTPAAIGIYCSADAGITWQPCSVAGTGTAATITVGTVTTLSAGAPATVSNAGTSSAAVFNFGLPTGPAGAAGSAGAAGFGFNPRGAWAASTTYNSGDVVTFGSQTYEADHTFTSGGSFVAGNWNLWAAKGADGGAGSTGAAGPSGVVPICSDTSGSGTAQTCTTSPTFTLTANSCVVYTSTTANSGAGLTLSINSSGAKPVAKWQGVTALAIGDLAANKPVLACYDGTNINLSTIGNAPAGGSPTGSAGNDLSGSYPNPTVARVNGSATDAWSCQSGGGDGVNAIFATTYPETTCYNDTGKTITLTSIKCYVDAGSTSTLSVTNGAGTALIASAGTVTCTSSFAAATQSSTVTLVNGDYIKFSFTADGTAKQAHYVITGTRPY